MIEMTLQKCVKDHFGNILLHSSPLRPGVTAYLINVSLYY